VASDDSIQIEYGGAPLPSRIQCSWKVMAWDKDGLPTGWSQPATWSMGLLEPGDWQARWIQMDGGRTVAPKNGLPAETPSPWLRKVFTLDAPPARALAYVNALGYFELYVNGRKVGGDVLAPAVTDYKARSLYVTYDIAPYLKRGANCVGIWLGRGWYTETRPGVLPGGPAVRAQLEISAAAGPITRIVSDESWKAAPSPYVTLGTGFSRQHIGERYDARREAPQWSAPEFTDAAWKPASLAPPFKGRVDSQLCPLNRIGKRIAPVSVTDLGDGLAEIDFGTDLSGWMRLKLPRLKAGQKITIHYCERRYKNVVPPDPSPAGPIKGTEMDRVFGGAKGKFRYHVCNQMDQFVSAGRPGESFCSKFQYHGFRMAVIEGLPTTPDRHDAEALLVESDLEPIGSFECSNALFNRIAATNLWTLRCLNLGGYMVDCPHRERLGYGDGQVSVESCVMNLWMPAFYTKWLADWRDGQNPQTGDLAHTAPDWEGGGGPGWGGTLAAMSWRMYQNYGDRRVLRENFEPMRRFVNFLESHCQDGVLRSYGGMWDFIGDWLPPHMAMDSPKGWPPRPAAEFFNNCYRVLLWDILRRSAEVLGEKETARECQAALEKMRPAIHKAFYDPARHCYVLEDQSYLAIALLTEIPPPSERKAVMRALEHDILVRRQGHLDSGMLGTYFMLNYLMQAGRNDLIFTMMNQKTYPGWGYMLDQGATTFWEQWNGYWSNLHSCFTSAGMWMSQGVAGIHPDPEAPGFKRFEIRPATVGDLTWARASLNSIRGRIAVDWKMEEGKFKLNVTVPVGATAKVWVPVRQTEAIGENGKPPVTVSDSGARFNRMESGAAVYEVPSGQYSFETAR
jgi:alpha-L-rhamnosidase